MLKHLVKFAFRSVISQKHYSLINILGLSVGLAAFMLIALYVQYELSYDRPNKDIDQIYRVVRNEYTCSPPPMAPTLKSQIPEIEYASRFVMSNNLLVNVGENQFVEEKYFWTDNEFFKIFTVDFLQGDSKSVLNNPTDIIISESIAHKYFGKNNPLGSTITVSQSNKYIVAGVFKDFPSNSHFHFDIVLPIKSYFEVTSNDPESWRSNYVYTYVKLHKGADLAVVNEKHVQFEKELTGWTPESGKPYEQYFFYQPIKEVHLYSHRKQELEANSSIKNVYIYSSIGLLILLIAGINYINLATAMSVNRQREIGIKKTLGANKKQLVNLFLTESVIVAIISTAIASVITVSFLPYFGNLMARDLSVNIKDLPFMIPALLLLAVAFGLISGLIPSRSMSNFSVIQIIRNSPDSINSKFGLRNMLVVTQFVVALVLIIVAINIQKQLDLILNIDPGYSKEQLVTIPIFDRSIKANMETIKEQLLKNKNILNVSSSYMLPHKINEFTRPQWFCDDPTECTPISYCVSDYNFVDLYDIEIVDGRNFSKDFPSDASGAFLLNEKAVKMLGWDSAIGKEITHWNGAKGVVVGVVKDFNFESLHTPIGPLYIMLNEKNFSFLSIKIKGGDIPETIYGIKSVFDKFSPGTPFNFTFFDEDFEQVYNGEKRAGSILIYFSVLAVMLGCLGLFGLSAFTIGQKTKEIGVRKVFGALNFDINILFTKSFITPVFLANLVAWPVAYYAISKWLENFAYKINITLWPFIISTAIVLVITSITINLHSKKVAEQTPAECLRH